MGVLASVMVAADRRALPFPRVSVGTYGTLRKLTPPLPLLPASQKLGYSSRSLCAPRREGRTVGLVSPASFPGPPGLRPRPPLPPQVPAAPHPAPHGLTWVCHPQGRGDSQRSPRPVASPPVRCSPCAAASLPLAE